VRGDGRLFGEAEILEGQMAQAVDRSIRSDVARAHLLKQFADGFGVQEALSGFVIRRSAFSRAEV